MSFLTGGCGGKENCIRFFQVFKPIHNALAIFYTKYSKSSFFKMLLDYRY